jgi:hypothetical protein
VPGLCAQIAPPCGFVCKIVCVAPRSVIDLLADQPEEALQTMMEAVQKELARLTVEAQQIDQALARKGRKARGGGDRLTREQVFEVLLRAGSPKTPAEVHEQLVTEGLNASLNSVRNHLGRLADQNGWLARLPEGRFVVSPSGAMQAAPGPDDDVPF